MSEDKVPMRVKKLSTASLGFTAKEVRKMVEGKGKMILLATMGGVVVDKFHGETDKGPWVGFKGVFAAQRYDGEQYTSSVAFFPNNVSKGIVDSLEQGVTELRVAVNVFAQESTKSGIGYEYICEPLISSEAQKKASVVTAEIFGQKTLPALAAPEKKKAS